MQIIRFLEIFSVNLDFFCLLFSQIKGFFVYILLFSYRKHSFFVKIWYVLNSLFIKLPRCWFFLILSTKTRTFSPTSKLLCNFFFLAVCFFLLYLSSLSDTFFYCSILSKLNCPKSLAGQRFLLDDVSFLTLFIFSAGCLIIVTAGVLAFCLSDMALSFDILLFSSLIFCSAANAFLPLRLGVNIVTLNLSFRSFILTCWNSLSTCSLVCLIFLLFWTSISNFSSFLRICFLERIR